MTAPRKKLLAWSGERERALAAWLERGAELGLDMHGYDGRLSASAAIGEALRRAAACRCAEGKGLAFQDCLDAVETVQQAANPLRTLRDAAGLTQSEAAVRLGMSRGAWANAEKAARATPAMVERARAGLR